jgi:hypothetical protein
MISDYIRKSFLNKIKAKRELLTRDLSLPIKNSTSFLTNNFTTGDPYAVLLDMVELNKVQPLIKEQSHKIFMAYLCIYRIVQKFFPHKSYSFSFESCFHVKCFNFWREEVCFYLLYRFDP